MKTFAGPAPGDRSYQAFSAPEDILVDHDLAADDRRRLLDAWKFELELSTETQTVRARHDEMLRRVNACRRLLRDEED